MTLNQYLQHLRAEERAPGTIDKYARDIRNFLIFSGHQLNKEQITAWKEKLLEQNYAPRTINSMLAAVHSFLQFCGIECRVKYLKVQRKIFRDPSKELSRTEYEKLISTSKSERLRLLMETICATGIRVSEVKYITLESVHAGKAEVALKGKIRTILIPGKLCHKLIKYARKMKITSGEIFLTRSGRSLSRRQIWAEMKKLCKLAGVDASKVFPHNLRHLFARAFYKASKDIVKLADVLGHSSIETTRIYLISSGIEHRRQLDRLGLIS